jgi:exopolysaccharide biosynthesis polyprenyl glycosylphosphotransferase
VAGPWPRIESASQSTAGRVLVILVLIVADYVAICAAFAAAYLIRFKTDLGIFYVHEGSQQGFYSSLVFWLVPLIVLVFGVYRLYSLRLVFDGLDEYTRIVSAATLSMLLVVLVSFFLDGDLVISRGWIVISWACLVFSVATTRFTIRRVVYGLRARGYAGRRVAVVASQPHADALIARLSEMPDSGLHVALMIDPHQLELDEGQVSGWPLAALIQNHRIDDVIVSAASVSQVTLAGIVRELSREAADLHLLPGMYEIQTTGVEAREIRGLPLVTLKKVRITGLDFALKRLLDYAVAVPVLIAFSPLLLGIAVAIRLTSPGPVLYRRKVMGERGRSFEALKFRTMRVDGEALLKRHPELLEELRQAGKLKDDPRITPIGRWLRRWSLDEMPQLLNVVRGQMSLVGPRMITEAELIKFGHWRDNLITVKPGLTGLWQVSGRSHLGYEDRVRLDMYYIRSYSIWRDLEILMRTVPAVLRGVGAY